MPTTYTVVQYVPDPIADERLNVGVIAVSGEHARSRFLTNWLRAERFGNASVRVLKDFARQVERAEIPALPIHEAGEHLELSEAKLRELAGQLDTHVLDAVVGNGRALLGAQGISFEVPEVKRIEPTLEATAWAVDDIRKRDADIPLGVVALAPRPDMLAYDVRRNAFERAQRIFDGLHADLVTEDDAARWAGQAVAGIGHLL